ncbi:hypothetical protein LGQ03_07290 [Loktanella sp. TSTF-M6]|uniref:Uncharacterized protein n=1 Tax=Loktanella gaetbuli TaxID=2881335 RepID=A0ABS8BTH5_9RHOB|nr:hypothetical protein [Loktanella gaetbuli]MCB5199040.1 hypothetical protein [Loktanella gaetbuli]
MVRAIEDRTCDNAADFIDDMPRMLRLHAAGGGTQITLSAAGCIALAKRLDDAASRKAKLADQETALHAATVARDLECARQRSDYIDNKRWFLFFVAIECGDAAYGAARYLAGVLS